ncbi:MAG: hypothetical protein ACR2QU_06575 [Gammaproteobacteria bacterium]
MLTGSVAVWLPTVILATVAINQIRLSQSESLSPWSGGGFGMFSTTDSPDNRHLHAVIQNDALRREVFLPQELATPVLRATTLPTRERLGTLAAELALAETDGTIAWDEIELQVWSIDYQPESLAPHGRLLTRERFNIAR